MPLLRTSPFHYAITAIPAPFFIGVAKHKCLPDVGPLMLQLYSYHTATLVDVNSCMPPIKYGVFTAMTSLHLQNLPIPSGKRCLIINSWKRHRVNTVQQPTGTKSNAACQTDTWKQETANPQKLFFESVCIFT